MLNDEAIINFQILYHNFPDQTKQNDEKHVTTATVQLEFELGAS
jgi:hypothetical protein